MWSPSSSHTIYSFSACIRDAPRHLLEELHQSQQQGNMITCPRIQRGIWHIFLGENWAYLIGTEESDIFWGFVFWEDWVLEHETVNHEPHPQKVQTNVCVCCYAYPTNPNSWVYRTWSYLYCSVLLSFNVVTLVLSTGYISWTLRLLVNRVFSMELTHENNYDNAMRAG